MRGFSYLINFKWSQSAEKFDLAFITLVVHNLKIFFRSLIPNNSCGMQQIKIIYLSRILWKTGPWNKIRKVTRFYKKKQYFFSSNHGTKGGDTIHNKIQNKLVTKTVLLTKMMIYWWAWPQPLSGLESRILWIMPGPIVCLPQLISSLEGFCIIGNW
jgi:hypothetical protein